MDVSARFAGAIVSFLLVAVILLQTSVTLGLVVLIGVPLLMLLIGPLLRPLQRRSAHQRHLMGELSNTATDIVGGLRVLRGIGGEQVFHDRYRARVADHAQGRRRGRAAAVGPRRAAGLPARRLRGARGLAGRPLRGRRARSPPGELVAFYGYAAFLMIPLRTATEYANKLIRARVAARAGLHGCSRCTRTTPTPTPGRRRRPRARTCRRAHRPAGRAGPAHGDRRRPARRVGRARRPARACAPPTLDDDVRLGGVPLTRAAPRGGTPPDRGLRHRRHAVLRAPRRPAGPRAADGGARPAPSTRPRADDILEALPDGLTPWSPSAAARSPAASGSGWCWPAR